MNKRWLDNSIGRLVGMTSRAIHNRLSRDLEASGFDLSAEQWIVLANIDRYEGHCQQFLADFCGKEKTSITRLLDTMESRGFIRRESASDDRRRNMVYLTEQGQKLLAKVRPTVEKTLGLAVEGVERTDFEVCKRVLMQVYGNVLGVGVEPPDGDRESTLTR